MKIIQFTGIFLLMKIVNGVHLEDDWRMYYKEKY